MPYIPDPAHIATDLILAQLLDEIRKIYEQATREAQEKVDEYLGWFEEADQIARERWKDGEITEQEYKNWRTSHLLTSNRFRDLAQQLAQDMANADMIAASIINGHLPDVYALNHNYATYEVEHQSLVDTSYTLYDRQTVERLLRENPDLLPWESVVKYPEVERWNEQLVSSIAAQSILQGEDVPTLARRISETLPTRNQNAAMRDARTIITSAENGGRIDAYNRAEGMGIKLKKQWMATLDGRTRHSHRKLDQEKRDTNEAFSNGCMFPGDPNGAPAEVYNCRCCLVTQIEGFEWQQAETSPKLGYVSYEEWKEGHNPDGGLTSADNSGKIKTVGIENVTGENATIDNRKFTEYALNSEKQPDKAKAFESALGYDLSNYRQLEDKIRENFDRNMLVDKGSNKQGQKYELLYEITGANGKTAKVLTAWLDDVNDKKDFHLISIYVDK